MRVNGVRLGTDPIPLLHGDKLHVGAHEILVDDVRHEAAVEFMRLRESIDCLIPRGGPSLIKAILENATVPYVIDGDGNCHVYVDASADLDMARAIVVNAKTGRCAQVILEDQDWPIRAELTARSA